MTYFLKVSLYLTFLLFFTLNAQAEYVGTSGFAIFNKRFPCDDFIEIHKSAKKPFASTLWGTFGTDATCLRRFAEVFKDRPHAIQIHLLNNTCVRNRNCREGEPFPRWTVSTLNKKLEARDPATLARLKARVERIVRLASGFLNPNTELILGLGLEDNYSNRAYLNLLEEVKPLWPWKLSRNPLHPQGKTRGDADLMEFHGWGARCTGVHQIANQDGTVFSEGESRRWLDQNSKCGFVALWTAESQGRTVSNGKVRSSALPPRSRSFRYRNKSEQKRLLRYAR